MTEILDTTLRDGEQTAGVSFNANEKLAIAGLLLEELKADRIEVASARVSNGEKKAFTKICSWAESNGYADRVEALGFLDGDASIDWIAECGGHVMNILAKGSLRHLEKQLCKTPSEHAADIKAAVRNAAQKGISCNIYLEDWSNGMMDSKDYVFGLLDDIIDCGIMRFMLPDTLGVLDPQKTAEFCGEIRRRYAGAHFDFHAHNDYSLAVANSLAAVRAGFNGVHATVNGLGERCGNAPMAALVTVLNDMSGEKTRVDESALTHVCKLVSSMSGIRIPANEPIVGENVFTQSAGIHADGDNKAHLYENALLPQRFGRERSYALGKVSGRANIVKNLARLGIKLSDDQIKLVTRRVVELGDKKEAIAADDLPFIIADVLKSSHSIGSDNIRVLNYSMQLTRGMKPVALVKLKIHGKDYEASSVGDGQYNAFMNALWSIYDRLGKKHPRLTDYQVSIPPGGKTDALVSTTIVWNNEGHEFKTRGIDSDQTEAAIKATVKMLNIIENLDILNNETENRKVAR